MYILYIKKYILCIICFTIIKKNNCMYIKIQVAELINFVKTIITERDQCNKDREEVQLEMEQLKKVIENLIDQSGQRTKEEIDKYRLKANENIEELLKQIYSLEKVILKI